MDTLKPQVRIFDNSFSPFGKSASLLQENKDVSPTHFEWAWDDNEAVDGVTFYTDGEIKNATRPNAIAWLLEPPHLRSENYAYALQNSSRFDTILTYDRRFLAICGNARFYPFGGSSIAFEKWGLYPKTKDVCMILSDKKTTEGHKFRHEIAAQFGDRIDLYGAGVGKPFDSKFDVLKDYRYCIVVESGRSDWYFTEKLIDCFSVGTIPIYWGCPDIERFFDLFGILLFFNSHDLQLIITTEWTYSKFGPYKQANIVSAMKYRVCEDHFADLIPS